MEIQHEIVLINGKQKDERFYLRYSLPGTTSAEGRMLIQLSRDQIEFIKAYELPDNNN